MTDQLRDAAILDRIVREMTGECSECGCHGDSCTLGDGERCCWVNALRTLCSNPHCIVQADKKRKRHKHAVKRAERDAQSSTRRRAMKRKVKGRAA